MAFIWKLLVTQFGGIESLTHDVSLPPRLLSPSADNFLVQAMAGAIVLPDLDLFRQFRDEVLSTTDAGRYYTDLYERTSFDAIVAMASHPDQWLAINQAMLDWTPAIQALVDGQGGTVAITPAMAAQAQAILADLRAVAAGDFAQIMDTETPALDPTTWSGMTIGDLLDRVESQTRPAPEVTTHPMTQATTAGSVLTLEAAADGAGPVVYQWYKDGVAINGATSATYTLPSSQRFHAGDYSVTATNPFGDTGSNTATVSINLPSSNNARLLNLSTRGLAQTGDNVLIPGFVIQGSVSKRLLIRAVGPTLALDPFYLPSVLPDPRIVLKHWNGSGYDDIAANDNWGDNTNVADIIQTAADVFAFGFQDDREAALLLDLPAGQYTAIVDDANGGTGVGVVELYDADDSSVDARLINISTRGFVGLGTEVIIPGFVVSSEGPKTFLIRVVGARLAQPPFNLTGVLADPKLELHGRPIGGTDALLFTQDNWSDNPDAANTAATASAVYAFALEEGSADAAFVVTLQPGIYTVVGSATDGTSTGVALVEVYLVP